MATERPRAVHPLVLTCLVLGCVTIGVSRTGAQTPTISPKLAEWLSSVVRHAPGQRDDPVTRLAPWPPGDVDAVLEELKKLLRAVERVDVSFWSLALQPYGVTDVPALNRMLKQAAILHADVAVLYRNDSGYSLPPDSQVNTLITDGRAVGLVAGTIHWEAGRRALDLVRPGPAADDDARLWYQATSAMLQAWGDYSGLLPHLARARALFPRDAALALYDGTVHENFAEPRLQNARAQAAPRAGPVLPCTRLDCFTPTSAPQPQAPFGTPDSEWRVAERLFRQALQIDPALSEARIRLARVLWLRGRHEEALSELQRVLTDPLPPLLRYYALGLLGREQQRLGRRDLARTAYAQASTLYPGAQSPRLGLSQLARDAGDQVQALAELEVLRQPPASDARADPWLDYTHTHVPDAFALIEELRVRSSR